MTPEQAKETYARFTKRLAEHYCGKAAGNLRQLCNDDPAAMFSADMPALEINATMTIPRAEVEALLAGMGMTWANLQKVIALLPES